MCPRAPQEARFGERPTYDIRCIKGKKRAAPVDTGEARRRLSAADGIGEAARLAARERLRSVERCATRGPRKEGVGMWGKPWRRTTPCSARCKDPGPGAKLPAVDQGTPRGRPGTGIADATADSRWMTTEVAARAVHVSPRTFRRYIGRGGLEAKPPGE